MLHDTRGVEFDWLDNSRPYGCRVLNASGEEAQKFVHELIGADEPLGWDTQLENELFFQLSRARAWRTWSSNSNHFDFLTHADISLGTVQSGVQTGATFRYGRNLISSYATTF